MVDTESDDMRVANQYLKRQIDGCGFFIDLRAVVVRSAFCLLVGGSFVGANVTGEKP